jgi:hypothetical protein
MPDVVEADVLRACAPGNDWRALETPAAWLQTWVSVMQGLQAKTGESGTEVAAGLDAWHAALAKKDDNWRGPVGPRRSALATAVGSLRLVYPEVTGGVWATSTFRALGAACVGQGVFGGEDMAVLDQHRTRDIARIRESWAMRSGEIETTGHFVVRGKPFPVLATAGRYQAPVEDIARALVEEYRISVQTAIEVMTWTDVADMPETMKNPAALAVYSAVRKQLFRWQRRARVIADLLPYGL